MSCGDRFVFGMKCKAHIPTAHTSHTHHTTPHTYITHPHHTHTSHPHTYTHTGVHVLSAILPDQHGMDHHGDDGDCRCHGSSHWSLHSICNTGICKVGGMISGRGDGREDIMGVACSDVITPFRYTVFARTKPKLKTGSYLRLVCIT